MVSGHRTRGCAPAILLICSLFSLGCNGDLSRACEEYCVERAACDREKGDTPSDTCESSCVEFNDDSFVDKANKCKGKKSCDYAVCIAE